MSYTPNISLRHYLESGNLPVAREMLQVILDQNTLPEEEVTATFEWAIGQRSDLLEPFDALLGELDSDCSNWTPDYYFRQKSRTSDNFSLERYRHLIAVRNHLRTIGEPRFALSPEIVPSIADHKSTVAGALARKKKLIALAVVVVILVILILS